MTPEEAKEFARRPLDPEMLEAGKKAFEVSLMKDIIESINEAQAQPHIHVRLPWGWACLDCGAECR